MNVDFFVRSAEYRLYVKQLLWRNIFFDTEVEEGTIYWKKQLEYVKHVNFALESPEMECM